MEAQEHQIQDAKEDRDDFYETNNYLQDQEAEFGLPQENEEELDAEKDQELLNNDNSKVNGTQSSTVAILGDLEHLIINLNHTAMEFLRNDQFAMSIRLLHKAEQNLMQVND